MAKNPAAARHTKALRRKKMVAEKKKTELFGASLAGQVAVAAQHPIQHCLINQGWEQTNMAQVWLARGETPRDVFCAIFLVDTLRMGVKDVFAQDMMGAEFQQTLDGMAGSMNMLPIEPAKARKLLRGVVAWARTERVLPHPDYPVLERLFGDVDPATSDAEFRFGLEALLRQAGPPRGPDAGPDAGPGAEPDAEPAAEPGAAISGFDTTPPARES